MQSTTIATIGQAAAQHLTWLEHGEQLTALLPAGLDLEATARASGALQRRREVRCAADLLRLILAYTICDWPLRLVATWYALRGLGQLSKTAVRQRLRHSVPWLGTLVAALLRTSAWAPAAVPAVRLRIVDATSLSQPGSRGTDWRVHLSLDLGQDRLAGIELSDAHGAETLARFPAQAGEIALADRGYARAKGLGPTLQAGGQIVVRLNWQNLPLEERPGQRLDVIAWLQQTTSQAEGPWEQAFELPTPQGRFAVRLVAGALSPEQIEKVRQRIRRHASKQQLKVDERTLVACRFVLIVTNLAAESWSAAQVLALYRLRWQIERRIKRLKSVLALDGLRAQDPDLAQAYLLGKLLGALLLDAMAQPVRARQPDWWLDERRPLNGWQLSRLGWQVLGMGIAGPLSWELILEQLGRLRRLLCDEPRRKRASQWVLAQQLVQGLSSC